MTDQMIVTMRRCIGYEMAEVAIDILPDDTVEDCHQRALALVTAESDPHDIVWQQHLIGEPAEEPIKVWSWCYGYSDDPVNVVREPDTIYRCNQCNKQIEGAKLARHQQNRCDR